MKRQAPDVALNQTSMATRGEKEPLLGDSESLNGLKGRSYSTSDQQDPEIHLTIETPVRLRRHLGLWSTVGIVIGQTVGSGIFISPKGVAQNAGSVGATLLVWTIMGLYALVQSLCYAELSNILPMTGGDYSYIYYILGPMMGFVCVWTQVILSSSSSTALIAQTAGLYLTTALDLQCHNLIVSLIAIVILVTCAAANCYSAKFGAWISSILSIAKVLALAVIIVAGVVALIKGHTVSFQNAFSKEGGSTDVGSMAIAMVEGYYAYKGWETVCTLTEEMINPKRTLPLALAISLTVVTAVYVLTNVAYFSMLSMSELLHSDAVAMTFAERSLGGAALLIPIFVFLSCTGTVNGAYLADARYVYAGGRLKQFPAVCCHVSFKFFSPIVAIIVTLVTHCVFSLIPALEQLMQIASLAVQIKIFITLLAVAYLKWKRPDIHRPIKIPVVVLALTIALMVSLIGLSVYSNPLTAGLCVGVSVLGVPVYFLAKIYQDTAHCRCFSDHLTKWTQLLLLVVPESLQYDPDEELAKQLLPKTRKTSSKSNAVDATPAFAAS